MNIGILNSVLSLLVLLGSATLASAQSNLLFTFDDSGPNVTATVTGSFDTSGLSFLGQRTPQPPVAFQGGTQSFFSFGTTTATNVDTFSGADAIGPANAFPFLSLFPVGATGNLVTPLSESLEINVEFNDVPGNAIIALAEGETIFDADALANNVIVFEESSLADLGNSSFLSTTPFTVLSDPGGANTIQFVVANSIPEPSSMALLLAGSMGISLLRRRK